MRRTWHITSVLRAKVITWDNQEPQNQNYRPCFHKTTAFVATTGRVQDSNQTDSESKSVEVDESTEAESMGKLYK